MTLLQLSLGEKSLVILLPKNACSGAVHVQLLSGEGQVQLKGATQVLLLTEEALKWVEEMKESYSFMLNKLFTCLDRVVPKTWRYSAKRLENNVSEQVRSRVLPSLGLLTSRLIRNNLILHIILFLFLKLITAEGRISE